MDEKRYNEITPLERRRALGQYFTPPAVARFMTAWACAGARTMLDPAAGNSVFLRAARERYPGLVLTGYEIDPGILRFFGNPAGAELVNADYLKSDWSAVYDAVVSTRRTTASRTCRSGTRSSRMWSAIRACA